MVDSQSIDLERFYAGERDVMTEIYREHVAGVERAVSGYCRGVEAECVVHDVFLQLLEREAVRRQFRGGDLGAWLRTIARNRAIDRLRRERRWTVLDDPRSLEGLLPPVEVEESLLHADQQRHLARALADFATAELPTLDPRLAQVFRLRLEERSTQLDAARALAMPRSTFLDHEQRLMKRLGRFLARALGKGSA